MQLILCSQATYIFSHTNWWENYVAIESYNDYDDYEGESSFNTLNKILVAYFATQQHPNKHVFFYVENAAYGWNWGGGDAMLVCHCQNPVVQYLDLT